ARGHGAAPVSAGLGGGGGFGFWGAEEPRAGGGGRPAIGDIAQRRLPLDALFGVLRPADVERNPFVREVNWVALRSEAKLRLVAVLAGPDARPLLRSSEEEGQQAEGQEPGDIAEGREWFHPLVPRKTH